MLVAERPKLLRLSDSLGPMQAMGVAVVLGGALVPTADGTGLVAHYRVGGYGSTLFDRLAPAVDGVLDEQLRRLKTYVETGKPQ